jgi:hypothetical protein
MLKSLARGGMSKIDFLAIPIPFIRMGQDFKDISLLFNLIPFCQKIPFMGERKTEWNRALVNGNE